jgi:hypothetical protein
MTIMEKYRLIKGFRKEFTGGSATPVYFQKKKGDIVEGMVRINPTTNEATALLVPFIVRGRRTNVSIPMDILKKYSEYASNETRSPFEGADENTELNKDNTSTIFTLKNIVMGVVGIAVVYGILKVTKVIK